MHWDLASSVPVSATTSASTPETLSTELSPLLLSLSFSSQVSQQKRRKNSPFLAAKITRWNPYFIGPFAIGGTTMGNVTYFLGLLIVSSRYYSYYRPKNQYMVIQAIMIVSLLVALFFGNVFGITSMVNVASTFAVLFVMEKVLEIPRIFEGPMLFVTLLGLSICLYMASFFLSTHPGWIVNMFSD